MQINCDYCKKYNYVIDEAHIHDFNGCNHDLDRECDPWCSSWKFFRHISKIKYVKRCFYLSEEADILIQEQYALNISNRSKRSMSDLLNEAIINRYKMP